LSKKLYILKSLLGSDHVVDTVGIDDLFGRLRALAGDVACNAISNVQNTTKCTSNIPACPQR
jgi:hypothetical protein